MVTLRSVNNDSFVKTTLSDGSILQPTLSPSPVGFSFLQPFFSKKGADNVITRFTGTGAFDLMYGSDLDNVKLYGHGGLIAREVLSGGGLLDACRLMPLDATYASGLLCVCISDESAIPAKSGTGTVNGRNIIVKSVPYDYTKTHEQNFAPKQVVISTVNYTVYPLIALKVDGRGTYGNDIGFRIYPDPSRSGSKTGDGRRYVLDIYERNASGALAKLGDHNEVISFSFNQAATAVANMVVPDSFDVIFDKYATDYSLPLAEEYSPENFDTIVEVLKPYVGTDPAEMVDFITGYDLSGNLYSKITVLTDTVGSIDTTSSNVTYLTGGDDGDMFDNTAVDILDPLTSAVIGHTTKALAAREQLLIDFYSGKIDDNLFDCRIIDCGVTLDASWPVAVKNIMSGYFGAEVRDDVAVILDVGIEVSDLATAQSVSKNLSGSVSHPYGSVAINIHNGKTTNRARNLRTSGNYDVAMALPRLYNSQGPFTVLAGFVSGRVNTMTFDFLPKVVKNDLQIQPLRDANLMFAMKLDRSGSAYYMSDSSQYSTNFSVLGSMRNLIFAGEVIRTFKKILVKYSFFPGDAAAAIPQATSELKTVFAGSYFPVNIPVTFAILQTRNDKLNGTATVNVSIQFPDVIKSWNVSIVANRTPIKS